MLIFLVNPVTTSIMIDNFENKEARSSGELWSEICSSLPEDQPSQGSNPQFTDSFQPASHVEVQLNGQSNGTSAISPTANWEPMEDSEIYIASLGIGLIPATPPTKYHLTFLSSTWSSFLPDQIEQEMT